MVVGSDLRFMIEKRLTDAGISIAFPQREIHLSADKPLRVSMQPPHPPTIPIEDQGANPS